MATKVVHVSDLSGRQVDQNELGQLTVVEHPEFTEPITLEALPQELDGLKSAEQLVRLEWLPPGARRSERYTIPLEDFNRLAETGNMGALLMEALAGQHQARGRVRRGRGERSRTRGRVDYTSPEHAGEPHRGRITEAEKTYVREHVDEVNARLREKGMREIDPNDSTMAERYGLRPSAA